MCSCPYSIRVMGPATAFSKNMVAPRILNPNAPTTRLLGTECGDIILQGSLNSSRIQ